MKNEFLSALRTLCTTHGVTVNLESNGVVRLVDTGEKKALWDTYAAALGLKPEWFGKRVHLNGKVFKIIGLLPGRPKNCIEIESHGGAKYVCSPMHLQRPGAIV